MNTEECCTVACSAQELIKTPQDGFFPYWGKKKKKKGGKKKQAQVKKQFFIPADE